MSYATEKHEPKTMKAKADLMLKRGSISEKQHKKLHEKADVEIVKAKAGKNAKIAPDPKVDALSAKGKGGVAATDQEGKSTGPMGKDADDTETPAKRVAATRKPVLRGQPLDEEERDV
jgi:hypothetical protein